MAKGFVNGNRKGKVGSEVYYTIKNSNNKVTQGVRIYQPNVTNPQSGMQRAQRMKMQPACNFYRALSSILDHSWEGVKYGAMSRQYFMKQALSRADIDFPFLRKGDKTFVPGSYPISQGSLTSIPFSFDSIYISLLGSYSDASADYGTMSQAIIRNNPGFEAGDQITFVAIYNLEDREVTTYMPVFLRFILDPNSTADVSSVLGGGWYIDEADTDSMSFAFEGFTETAGLSAVAVIHSRKNVNGGEVWQRSTEYLHLSDGLLNEWMSPAQYQAALASYLRTQSNFESDYYLNDAETPEEVSGGGADANVNIVNSSITFGFGNINQTADALLVYRDDAPVEAVAVGTHLADEGPDGSNATLAVYIVRGNVIKLLNTYRGTAAADASVSASAAGTTLTVLTPQQFLAKYSGYTLE